MLSRARFCIRFVASRSPFLCFAFVALGCGSSAPKGPQLASAGDQPPTEVVHEDCDITADDAVKFDVNGDGRPDIIQVMKGGREVCRATDLNFDGRVDIYSYFDDQGRLRRRESDFDRDGLIDEIAYFKNGVVFQKHRETNLDGKLDTWDTFAGGRLTERMVDSNRDGKVDQWWTFPVSSKPECPLIALDESGAGKPTVRHDMCKGKNAGQAASVEQAPQPAAPQPASQPKDGGS